MDFFKKASASFGGNGGESDLVKQAEGFLGSSESTPKTEAPKSDAPVASTEKPAADAAPAAPPAGAQGSENYSEIYGSAQTLYQGLQDKLGGKKSTIDDQELAGAASNVLKAAENAGFAKDSQYGQYFDKAESYLGKYGQSKETAAAPTSAPAAEAPAAAAAPAAAPPASAPTTAE